MIRTRDSPRIDFPPRDREWRKTAHFGGDIWNFENHLTGVEDSHNT